MVVEFPMGKLVELILGQLGKYIEITFFEKFKLKRKLKKSNILEGIMMILK